ncbi:hypothetical protein CLAVI_000271 [Candidatus Clavichlamydia salmonicola]|uniref:CT620/CT621 family type III secretion system effector n=1 Tax=Candidatus Clavichlamydia salmonicola TaxID=469812 RepID=UPI001891E198|nr:CT620/CT621 family type III secretion system effector [Candidatus Clavichlamydia salmonicola]MBF5050657.1 hypothetical protein [Candidatus Clavichlamydia salmonicola]
MSILEVWNAKDDQSIFLKEGAFQANQAKKIVWTELEIITKNDQEIATLQHFMDTLCSCKNNFEAVVTPSSSYEKSLRSKISHELSVDDLILGVDSIAFMPEESESLLSSLKFSLAVTDSKLLPDYPLTVTASAIEGVLTSLSAFVTDATVKYPKATNYITKLNEELTLVRGWVASIEAIDRVYLADFIKTFGNTLAKEEVDRQFVNDYWDAVTTGYESAMKEVISAHNSLKEDLTLGGAATQVLQECSAILQGLFACVTVKGEAAGGINYIDETALCQMSKNVEDILRLLSFLSTDDQAVVQQGLTKFFQTQFDKVDKKTSATSTINSGDVLAGVWVYMTINEIVSSNPEITLAEIKTKLSTAFQPFSGLTYSFITNYQAAISNFKTLGMLPNSGSSYNLVSFTAGKAKMNANFLPSIIQVPPSKNPSTGVFVMVNNISNVNDSLTRLNTTVAALNTIVTDAQSVAKKRVAALEKIASLRDLFEVDQQKAIATAIKSKPLPAALVTLLLDNYMPGEEQYLQGLVSELNSSNYGAQIGNDFLQNLLSYLNASTTFTFGSYLGSPTDAAGTIFSGSASAASAQLTAEKTSLKAMLGDTLAMIDLLSTYRSQVTDSTGLSTVQKKSYMIQLQQYENSLRTIVSQFSLVNLFLENIVITPPAADTNSGIFTVTWGVDDFLLNDNHKWLKRLVTAESVLASGNPGETVSGGLSSFYAQVHADQQSAADAGQSVQLNLQMQLTAMQQQWSVVATALQVLNQVYLAVARSMVG